MNSLIQYAVLKTTVDQRGEKFATFEQFTHETKLARDLK